jgi:hypothetical protein
VEFDIYFLLLDVSNCINLFSFFLTVTSHHSVTVLYVDFSDVYQYVFIICVLILALMNITPYCLAVCCVCCGGTCSLALQSSPRQVNCLGELVALCRERAGSIMVALSQWHRRYCGVGGAIGKAC